MKTNIHFWGQLAHFFLEWEMFQTKYCRARQATDDNMPHAHCMLDTKGCKHTLRICNTCCLSTATMLVHERTPVLPYMYFVLSCWYIGLYGDSDYQYLRQCWEHSNIGISYLWRYCLPRGRRNLGDLSRGVWIGCEIWKSPWSTKYWQRNTNEKNAISFWEKKPTNVCKNM